MSQACPVLWLHRHSAALEQMTHVIHHSQSTNEGGRVNDAVKRYSGTNMPSNTPVTSTASSRHEPNGRARPWNPVPTSRSHRRADGGPAQYAQRMNTRLQALCPPRKTCSRCSRGAAAAHVPLPMRPRPLLRVPWPTRRGGATFTRHKQQIKRALASTSCVRVLRQPLRRHQRESSPPHRPLSRRRRARWRIRRGGNASSTASS